MFASKFLSKFTTVLTVLILALGSAHPALAAPPLNDNFADAESITALPAHVTVDVTDATTESFEPQVCWFMPGTVWYSFTPSQNITVRADTFGSSINTNLNVYRSIGGGINGLLFQGCAAINGSANFFFEAGQTYYIQAGPIFGEVGNIQLNIEEYVPPPPTADFNSFPGDPSMFDVVTFCDGSFDPGGFGFNSFSWDFGDGSVSTDNCAVHQYAADGDYTVYHEATTIDGRTASVARVVQVRTHDVAITKISAPQSARSGQTRTITVYVKNKSYAETVRIELYRSVPGGLQLIGSYLQFVPARSTNRTVEFTFNYTFTSSDANIGKVSFKAFAHIESGRDALPADNEAISSPPTKVTR